MSNRNEKGVAAVNRETSLESIREQLAELSDHQLTMVADFVKGLWTAGEFLNRK